MKKYMNAALSLLLAGSLTACGSSSGGGSSSKEWTRTGSFEDTEGNYLIITESEDAEHPGYAITLLLGNEPFGWFIQQEGNTLHGDLIPDYMNDPEGYIVTISEDGADGVKLEAENTGKTYTFTKVEIPETAMVLRINVRGSGYIAYAEDGGTPEFEDDFPMQTAQINMPAAATYVVAAKADEGYKFVKWTKNGEDLSTEEQVSVEITEDTELVAVFEAE